MRTRDEWRKLWRIRFVARADFLNAGSYLPVAGGASVNNNTARSLPRESGGGMMRIGRAAVVLAAFAVIAAAMLPAAANAQMHDGFLPGPGPFGEKPLNLLGTTQVTSRDTKPDLVADVAVDPDGEVAYLANWGEPTCAENSEGGGKDTPAAGVWVIDISNVEDLPEVDTVEEAFDFPIITFIPHSQDTSSRRGDAGAGLHTKGSPGRCS